MKLYYDNLIAFMPIGKTTDEDGKVIPDIRLEAARGAMIMLADFQSKHNIIALYESIRQISIYAGVDIVDLMLSLGDVEVESRTVDELLDIAAKNLFKTSTADYDYKSFDYKYYSAILLSITHTILALQNQAIDAVNANNTVKQEETAESPNES